MSWLSDQLARHMLFRRLSVIIIMAYVWMVTSQSFEFVRASIERGIASGEIVAILASVVTFPTAVIGYVFKVYSGARSDQGGDQ
jgi:hypothetical protein